MNRDFRAFTLRCAVLLLGLLCGAVSQASTIDLLPGTPGYVHEVFTAGDGWFRVLCAALACAAAFGLFREWRARRRVRQRRLEAMVEERTATIARQAEKLRELDDLKSQFFANVSHELRTPLTLTLGPLQDALDGRFGPLREELADQVQVALSNAQRLLGLVDQLLDVARLSAGRLRLRPRRGDVAAAVRQRAWRPSSPWPSGAGSSSPCRRRPSRSRPGSTRSRSRRCSTTCWAMP